MPKVTLPFGSRSASGSVVQTKINPAKFRYDPNKAPWKNRATAAVAYVTGLSGPMQFSYSYGKMTPGGLPVTGVRSIPTRAKSKKAHFGGPRISQALIRSHWQTLTPWQRKKWAAMAKAENAERERYGVMPISKYNAYQRAAYGQLRSRLGHQQPTDKQHTAAVLRSRQSTQIRQDNDQENAEQQAAIAALHQITRETAENNGYRRRDYASPGHSSDSNNADDQLNRDWMLSPADNEIARNDWKRRSSRYRQNTAPDIVHADIHAKPENNRQRSSARTGKRHRIHSDRNRRWR